MTNIVLGDALVHEMDGQLLDLEVAATAEDGEKTLQKRAVYSPGIVSL